MKVDYVPLLERMREFYRMPRAPERFQEFLRIGLTPDRQDVALPPFLSLNPMAREHVSALIDDYLALDGDRIAAESAASLLPRLAEFPGRCRLALTVLDDLKGGWTNRFSCEYETRFGVTGEGRPQANPRPGSTRRGWIAAPLWSTEPAAATRIRESIGCVLFRAAYVDRHGPAQSLREKLAQEGWVMAQAGCAGPTLDADDLDYSRQVLKPFLEVRDTRTGIECLFGDAAGATLGFTPRGLSAWAGLAVALADARQACAGSRSAATMACSTGE